MFDVFQYTHPGSREVNEDAFGLRTEDGSGVFVVADGLGGHRFGELASKTARDIILDEWDPLCEDRRGWMENVIAYADGRIHEIQEQENSIMKTTAAVLCIDGDIARWATVGDTRIYMLRDGHIESVTSDHSVAFMKYRSGEINRREIAYDEDQSSLLRCLGGDRANPTLSTDASLESGDSFLLCTDGVWEYVYDEEILADYLRTGTAKEWGISLLSRMIPRTGKRNDNLSLIGVRVY